MCIKKDIYGTLRHCRCNLNIDFVFTGETVEFGTVLVYTCPSACWNEVEAYQEEAVVIQADPDLNFVNKKAADVANTARWWNNKTS